MNKDKPLVIIICLVLVSVGGYYLFSNSSVKRECEEKISYRPATEIEGALGKSKVDEHYVFIDSAKVNSYGEPYSKDFKTKKDAVDYCVISES